MPSTRHTSTPRPVAHVTAHVAQIHAQIRAIRDQQMLLQEALFVQPSALDMLGRRINECSRRAQQLLATVGKP